MQSLPRAKPNAEAEAEDLAYITDIIWDCLRAHLPPNNHTRLRVAGHIGLRDGNGDCDNAESPEDLKAIIDEFGALPAHEQRHILNGWSPDSLKFNRAEYEHTSLPMIPYLTLHANRDSSILTEPIGEFSATHDDGPQMMRLLILPGTTKAEAMRAIHCLAHQLDEHWDRLIMDPLKERQHGK